MIVLHHLAVFHPLLAAQLVRSTLRPEIFFVVSGALYRRALWPLAGRADLLAFAARLLRRLYPAYLLFLLLAAAAYGAKHWTLHHGASAPFRSASVYDQDPWVLVKNLLLVQDVWPRATASLNYPSWAISDFVWVALACAAACAGLRGRARIGLLAAMAAAGYTAVLAGPEGAAFDLGRCAASFVIGLAAAALAPRVAERGTLGGALAVAGAAGALALMQFDGLVARPFAWMPPCAALLVAGLLAAPHSVLARGFAWRPLVALGRLSYTLILAHGLVVIAVERLLERFAGMRCSVAERPCEQGLSLPAALAAIALVLGASIALSVLVQRLADRWRAPRRAQPAPGLEAA
jgi:peptidoglycan/LPS O-acetylase OafA/YrhL